MDRLSKALPRWLASEDGAITVDWVVLTASLLLLGFVVVSAIADDLEATKSGIAACMAPGVTCDDPTN